LVNGGVIAVRFHVLELVEVDIVANVGLIGFGSLDLLLDAWANKMDIFVNVDLV